MGFTKYEIDNQPETAYRTSTDIKWSLLFTACATVFGVVLCMAFHGSSLKHFHGLPDDSGRICGVSPGVVHKPFLVLCDQQQEEQLRAVCVESCSLQATNACSLYQPATSYKTTKYAGILCMPTGKRLGRMFSHLFLEDSYTTIMMLSIAFTRAWPAIFCAGAVAILLSFLYLHLVSLCGRVSVLLGLGLIVAGSLLSGAYLIQAATHFGEDGILGTGDSGVGLAMGICLLVFTVLVVVVVRLWRNNIKSSVACIKAGSECMRDMPSIFFEPFLALAWRLCVMVVLILGFLHVVAWFGSDETGLVVRLYGRWHHRLYMVFYVVMSIWILEVSSAMSYFAISYATQQWFFADYNKILKSKDAPKLSTCSAYTVAWRYHLGTLVYGSACIAFFRVPRMIQSALVYGGLCPPCLDFLRYMTPQAYMDVALNGAHFWKAAQDATSTVQHKSVAFFTAHSAPWLVQFTGLCFVSAVGGAITYCVCRFSYLLYPMEATEDVASSFYVPVPSLIGFYAAVICGCVAMPFMLLIGHISDNIIFCYSVERQRLEMKPVSTLIDSVSGRMLSGLSCTGREHHESASTQAQPPNTHALLAAASHD